MLRLAQRPCYAPRKQYLLASSILRPEQVTMPRRAGRGYPTAVLTVLDAKMTTIYVVYSRAARLHMRLPLSNKGDEKEAYLHAEAVVRELRPLLRGEASSLVVAARRKEYASQFVEHLRRHHRWIVEGSGIRTLTGSAETDASANELIRGAPLREALESAAEDEESSTLELLERYLTQGEAVYTIEEARDLLASNRLRHIIVTETLNEAERGNPRFQSLVGLARNAGVRVRIAREEGSLGARARQLGGMVGLGEPPASK